MPAYRLTLTIVFVFLIAIPGAVPCAGADARPATPARRLTAAGSERILWLVVSEWNENREEFSRRFYYREPASDRIRALSVVPHSHRIAVSGVVGQTLHAFFENGAHIRFSKSRRWRGHQLPGRHLPLAVAGEVRDGKTQLWAVVTADSAAAVESHWRERQDLRWSDADEQTEQPQGPKTPVISALPGPSKPPREPQIVLYDGVSWQPGIPVPKQYSGSTQVWLAIADGRFHLFWVNADDLDHVNCAHYENDKWAAGAPIALDEPITSAAVAVQNKHLVFVALLKETDLSSLRVEQRVRPVAAPLDEPWDEPASLLDEDGGELKLPLGSAVGLFSDRLALMRFGDAATGKDGEGEPQVGFWAAGAGGSPDQPFEALPAWNSRDGPAGRRSPRDLVATLIVAAVILLLLWRRQEAIASPVELPAGFQLAGLGRRAAALVLDALPAAVIVGIIWSEPLSSFYVEFRAASQAGEPLRELPTPVLWALFWWRIIYTAYSLSFEMAWSATPGKRLLGCRVLSENLDRAGPIQIIIRNATRMVEFEPFLKIWPFMLIILFTRNRQRLGDLLARTVVVERLPQTLLDEQNEKDPGEDS